MPTRTSALHGFSIEPARAVPVAAISPAEQSRVIGALIRLDGRGSSSTDDEELSYAWSFIETPLGSTVETLTDVEGDGSVVTFVPDLTGLYTIGLVVSTPYRDSVLVEATVEATSVLVPLTERTTPDGAIMFRVVSSFWRMVERNALFSTIWSGYMQIAGNDLLRAFQVDYGKSISTIQALAQRRWLDYSPALELDSTLCTATFGYHRGGTGAFTVSGAVAATGIIISEQEVILLDGTPSLDAIGTSLVVYTSAGAPGNTGSYLINRLNSDSSGYIVSSSTPFPSAASDLLVERSTLVSFAGSTDVYDSDGTLDFTALGVESGDVVRIVAGADAGYYTIEGVGVADGLTNDRTLRLDRAPTQTSSGRSYSIFNKVRLSAVREAVAATNTVYIPEDEADLSVFDARSLVGTATVSGSYEILVEERHLFSAMVGERIQVTSGTAAGRSYTITGLNSAGTGYLVGSAIAVTSFPEEVVYSLQSTTDIADRLLVLEDEAYEIVSVTLDDGTAVSDGGRGALWAVTLAESTAPAGREGMSWRIAAALETTEHEDLEEIGITAGDLLILEVVRADTGFTGLLPCYVLGAAGSKLAFDFGTTLGADGAPGALTDAEILELAGGLQVPRVYEDDSGEIQITLLAEELQAFLTSRSFESTYANLPISSSTVFDLDGSYEVTVRVARVVRNTRIPVDDALVSVPSLFEYIDTPAYGTNEDGEVVLVGRYGESVVLDREPLELIENRDYSLSSDESTTGTNLQTTAASAVLVIPGGNLIDRDLRVGDYIDIESGFDQDRYYVRAVLDEESVSVATSSGDLPATTATGLSYTLRRRTAGNFLRFVDGMFTPAVPAPDRFWAQLSLFENDADIEANFGILVGVTKAQLDEYGSSQVSYKGAVQALMYAWTSGPTVRNVTIGSHILMGLPVTEVRGRVLQIDKTYDDENGRGRVLIEDLNEDGDGTGLVRIYYFDSDVSSGLSDFQGLAENPETGSEYAVEDEVPAFAPLSRGIIVSDYLTDPTWWKSAVASGSTELQKFHTWQVAVDAHQVDSRDMPLIRDFCMGIRPIYTQPILVLVLYLYDEVTVEDALALDADLLLSDDPVLSVEATHMVDSYNGSSLAHRVFDHGSFSTRTLFEGLDLETTAGSGVVTSARGGFMGVLDETPLDHAPEEAVGVLDGVNEWFTDGVYYRGTPLVRTGDVLYIRTGNNRGRYTVVSVDSNTQVTVDELPDYPPTTRPAAEIEAATGQAFQIQRLDTATITEGTAQVVSSTGGDDPTTTIENTSGNFRWDGVAVGDLLVVLDGADYGTHEILQVGTWDAGDLVDTDTRLIVRGTLAEVAAFTYEVLRDDLRSNPLHEVTDLETTAGSNRVTSAAAGLSLLALRRGDLLLLQSGTDATLYLEVLDVVDDTTLYVDQPLTATESGVQARIVRPGTFEVDEPRDEDWELEKLCAHDRVDVVLVEPRTLVVGPLLDLVLANDVSNPDPTAWTASATSATDLEAAGVVVGDKLDVDVAAENSRTMVVTAVSGTEVTVSGLWLADESPVTGSFFTLAAAWEVLDDTATLTTIASLEGVVIPGDHIEVDGVGEFVVAGVSGAVLTLTRDTGVTPAASYTGRATRRLT